MNITPAAILGCGPSALLSAWACSLAGIPVAIVSRGVKSRLGGAQFLHAPIPGMHRASEPETFVKYERRGDPDIYRKKAFGDLNVEWKPWTEGGQPEGRAAWSLDMTYQYLWESMEPIITNEMNVREIDMKWFEEEADQFLFVVNTVPLASICVDPKHNFITQRIVITPTPFEGIADDTVLYDGTGEKSWYRTSNIFGTGFTEWGEGAKVPPGIQTFRDFKPMSTNCDCLKKFHRVVSVGRRGKWSAREFSHNAFYDTMNVIGVLYGR